MSLQTKSKNKWKFATVILSVALLATLVIGLYQVSREGPVYAEYMCLGVSVVPGTETKKLGVNESYTLSAHLENGTAPFTYQWRISPSANLTVSVNGETYFLNETKVFTTETLTLLYPVATEEYVTVDLTVKDSHLLSGNILRPVIIADPYTAPTQYLNSANVAAFSYKIESDGLGWYRAVNGSDGSICFTSTNASYVLNSATANGGLTFVKDGNYLLDQPWNILVSGTTVKAESWNTKLIRAASMNGSCIQVSGRRTTSPGVQIHDVIVDGFFINGTKQLGLPNGASSDVNCKGILVASPIYTVNVDPTPDQFSTNNVVQNCKVVDCGSEGISFDFQNNSKALFNVCFGNQWQDMAMYISFGCTVSGNHFIGDGSVTYAKTGNHFQVDGGLNIGGLCQSFITGNIFENYTAAESMGLILAPTTAGQYCYSNIISSNEFIDCYYGVMLGLSGYSQTNTNVLTISNTVSGNIFKGGRTAVDCTYSDRNEIYGNTIYECRSYGVALISSSLNNVQANTIRNVGYQQDNFGTAIRLTTTDANNCLNNTIALNKIYVTYTNKTAAGISEKDSLQNFNTYSLNDITGCYAPLVTYGTGDIIFQRNGTAWVQYPAP